MKHGQRAPHGAVNLNTSPRWRWQRIRSLAIAAVLALICLPLLSGVASAHALLVRSNPAASATVDCITPPTDTPTQNCPDAPTQVQLWFSEDINPVLSKAVVVNVSNQEVDRKDSHVSSSDPKEMDLGLQPLQPGVYIVIWQSTSAEDGHTTGGNFYFRVKYANGAIPALPSELPTGPSGFFNANAGQCLTGSTPLLCAPEVLSEWGVFLSYTLLVGGLFWQFFMVELAARRRRAFVSLAVGTARRFRKIALLALPLFILANIGYIAGQAMLDGGGLGSAFSPTIWGGILLHSSFGIFWMLSELFALLALLLLVVFPGRPVEEEAWRPRLVLNWAQVGVLALLLLAMALSSHAAAAATKGGLGTYDVPVDWLHLLTTGIWLGGLFFIVLILLPVLWKQEAVERGQALVTFLPRFSVIAITCVIIASLSGSYNAAVQLSSLDQLINTTYGRTLIVKTSLFLVMVMISAYHAFLIRPRLSVALGAWDRLHGALAAAPTDAEEDERVKDADGNLENESAQKAALPGKKQAANLRQARKPTLRAKQQTPKPAPRDAAVAQEDEVSLEVTETQIAGADDPSSENGATSKAADESREKTSWGSENGHQRKDGKDTAESGRVLARIERLGDQLRLWIRREATLGAGVLLCAALLGGLAGSLAPAAAGAPNINAPPLTPTTKTPVDVTMKTTDGVLNVTLKVAPAKFGTNSVGVLVVDAKTGKTIDGANVHLIINMVEMDMGTGTSDLQSVGGGFYTGQADLLMGGHWTIEVQIRTPQNPNVISNVTFTIPVSF